VIARRVILYGSSGGETDRKSHKEGPPVGRIHENKRPRKSLKNRSRRVWNIAGDASRNWRPVEHFSLDMCLRLGGSGHQTAIPGSRAGGATF
jgi:hypothetical protein